MSATGRRDQICSVARTVRARTLRVAADRLGGARKLRDLLGVSSAEVADWLAGVREPNETAFLRALELILDGLDAENGDER